VPAARAAGFQKVYSTTFSDFTLSGQVMPRILSAMQSLSF
jgi:hypothetical protein